MLTPLAGTERMDPYPEHLSRALVYMPATYIECLEQSLRAGEICQFARLLPRFAPVPFRHCRQSSSQVEEVANGESCIVIDEIAGCFVPHLTGPLSINYMDVDLLRGCSSLIALQSIR